MRLRTYIYNVRASAIEKKLHSKAGGDAKFYRQVGVHIRAAYETLV